MREPRVEFIGGQHRWNLHNNVRFQADGIWRLSNLPADGAHAEPSERRRLGLAAIRKVLGKAEAYALSSAEEVNVRALGAAWSLSPCADVDEWLLDTTELSYLDPALKPTSLHRQASLRGSDLALIQCGTRIAAITDRLGRLRRSLLTSGASNGQTIVGATATGTHGSAIDGGSLHDTIRGLHIVVQSNQSFWVEPATPVLRDAVVEAHFGPDVTLIRDDDVFNASLVSFGSFGVIESVLVETEPLFLLTVYRFKQRYDSALQEAISTLRFDGLPMPEPRRPYHFEVSVDPYTRDAYVTVMYKVPAGPEYEYPRLPPRRIVVTDPLTFVGLALGAAVPDLTGHAVSHLLAQNYPLLAGQNAPRLPLGVVFRDVIFDTRGGSTELGVPIHRAVEATDVILERLDSLAARHHPFLGPVALRFVRASKATLAFTQYEPVTCTIELPAARTSWLDEVYDEVWGAMAQAGIPHTFHWGQEHNLTATRVRQGYGDARVDRWLAARRRLLGTDALRARFANPLLVELGLDD